MTYIPVALRQLISERAEGRCEYCLTPDDAVFAAHEIDHVIAEKHGGLTDANNLALSCSLCNKQKGSDLTSIDPETNQIVRLFNPREDRWRDHFRLSEGRIVPLSATGRVTEKLLRLNNAARIKERNALLRTIVVKK